MNHRSLIIFLAWLLSLPAFPAARTHLGDGGLLLELSTDRHFTKAQNYPHVDAFNGGLSTLLWDRLTLGTRYHYWLAEVHEVQGVLGVQFGNPRVRYRLLGAVGVPLSVKSIPECSSFLYDARVQVILKLNTTFSWLIESGYRWANLGTLSSGVGLDLSGPFLGTGIGIHF
jgi:hypothetical protein